MSSVVAHRPRRLALAVVAAAALVLAACGSDDGKSEPERSAEVTSPPPTTGASAQTRDIDETFWYSGFKVTLGEAALEPGRGTATLTIDAEFENEGDDSATFSDVAISLASAGENYQLDTLSTDLPTVPGASKGKGTFAFMVEPSFSFDDAVLTIGNPDNNQAVVPFGEEGELVSNEPVPITSTASGTAGEFTLQLKGGEIRFDDPDTHRPIEKGHTLIVLDFDVTRNGGQNDTTFIGTENLALKLPDGTSVAVRNDGISNPVELISPDATLKDLTARFEGDNPYAGTYTLVLKYTVSTGPAETEIPFTVEARSSGGPGTTAVR